VKVESRCTGGGSSIEDINRGPMNQALSGPAEIDCTFQGGSNFQPSTFTFQHEPA
jgi:hypothetical protein